MFSLFTSAPSLFGHTTSHTSKKNGTSNFSEYNEPIEIEGIGIDDKKDMIETIRLIMKHRGFMKFLIENIFNNYNVTKDNIHNIYKENKRREIEEENNRREIKEENKRREIEEEKEIEIGKRIKNIKENSKNNKNYDNIYYICYIFIYSKKITESQYNYIKIKNYIYKIFKSNDKNNEYEFLFFFIIIMLGDLPVKECWNYRCEIIKKIFNRNTNNTETTDFIKITKNLN
jgi:hypothetical protein